MPIISDLEQINQTFRNPVLTIGNFDGVHKGHLSLFALTQKRAAAINGQSAVMTFDPHPIKVMNPGNAPRLITLTEQKLELISAAGMDIIFCLPFTPTLCFNLGSRFCSEHTGRQNRHQGTCGRL